MSKSCLQSSLIILTDFHNFTVNEEKLQNQSKGTGMRFWSKFENY